MAAAEYKSMMEETEHQRKANSVGSEVSKPNTATTETFSWSMAVDYFERKTSTDRMGTAELYKNEDGQPIEDEGYLKSINIEVCRELGLQLLDVLVDLIRPVGFGYPSLLSNLHEIVADAFKVKWKPMNCKTIVWIEDEHWNSSDDSVLETLVGQFILNEAKLSLITPMKYFDKEVLSTAFNIGESCLNYNPNGAKESWRTLSALFKFAFLLNLRSKSSSVIVLHFSRTLAEEIEAFAMIDLAEAEGHTVKYFQNFEPSPSKTPIAISNFVSDTLNSKKPAKKSGLFFWRK